VSRFESGERDIQLSSATNILGVLGMLDERVLVFPRIDARANGERVIFTGKDGGKAVDCAISREALEDHFGGDNKDMLRVFKANRERIEHEARRKYVTGRIEPDGSVLIRTNDL
jgi:Protein of unknown function (DUF1488)